ncbi:MAG: hypothetical protein AAB458_00700 [Patescibacteria group bacterium]
MSIDQKRMQEALPGIVIPKTLNVGCRDLSEEKDLDKLHYEKNQEERDLGERIDIDLLIEIESHRFFNQNDTASVSQLIEGYLRFEGTAVTQRFLRKIRFKVEEYVKDSTDPQKTFEDLTHIFRSRFISGYTLFVLRCIGNRFFPVEEGA